MIPIRHYVALGDSMSDCDHYAATDAAQRFGSVASQPPYGSVSLLWKNRDDLWPDFTGRDLSTLCPGATFHNLSRDGDTTGGVLRDSTASAVRCVGGEPAIVTLTIGGNDLLEAVTAGGVRALPREAKAIMARFREIVDTLRVGMPNALLVLTTVYDPTDGTGMLPGMSDMLGRLPIEVLDEFNNLVRKTAGTTSDAVLADVHLHFVGHGVSADELDGYYWSGSIIEPGALGASEIRRVWLDAILEYSAAK